MPTDPKAPEAARLSDSETIALVRQKGFHHNKDQEWIPGLWRILLDAATEQGYHYRDDEIEGYIQWVARLETLVQMQEDDRESARQEALEAAAGLEAMLERFTVPPGYVAGGFIEEVFVALADWNKFKEAGDDLR